MSVLKNEPVRVTAAFSTLVNAGIALLIGFQVVTWTDIQVGLVVGLWNAFVGVALTFAVRNAVTPQPPV